MAKIKPAAKDVKVKRTAARKAVAEVKKRYPAISAPKKWNTLGQQFITLGKDTWSVARLCDLSKDFPVYEFPLAALDISTIGFSRDIIGFIRDMRHILEADLDEPIIMSMYGEIFDGRHRIAKAIYEERETIKVKRFETNVVPDRVDE